MRIPNDLLQGLQQHGQEHVLRWWDTLDEAQQSRLVDQLRTLDLDMLASLYQQRDQAATVPDASRIGPISVIPAQSENRARREQGEAALSRGEVAALVVAGGQGSRLGCSFPKGMYPIGPVSGATLFEIHTAKVLAIGRRYGRPIPLLIMTSEATHADTVGYFEEHQFFGLARDDVWFFRQGTMPALDMETGKLLMGAPAELCLSPNGHGGTLRALADSGLLDRVEQRGIRQMFYFQVDNPLVKVADPVFIGQHLAASAEVSTKVVAKLGPTDKLGNLVLVDRHCSMIEYSDLPESLGNERDEQGRLQIWAGNTAIHLFAMDFLQRVSRDRASLPFHIARKKVPHLDQQGKLVTPDRENAIKFELFIFDVLPLAQRWTVVETTREEEFAPLKNASGPDSEETVKQALVVRAAAWLEAAGVKVPRRADGNPLHRLEISPLFSSDLDELKRKLPRGLQISGPLLLQGD